MGVEWGLQLVYFSGLKHLMVLLKVPPETLFKNSWFQTRFGIVSDVTHVIQHWFLSYWESTTNINKELLAKQSE